jgi:hypothetical protein
MDAADKAKFKQQSIELLDHLVKMGWVESYFHTAGSCGIKWTDRGERRIAALRLMDSELTIGESHWNVLLTLIYDTPLEAGRQILDGKV